MNYDAFDDKLSAVDDVFTFTKRLWTIVEREYLKSGEYPGTLVVIDDKGVHALPVATLPMNTPEDIASVTTPWMKKRDIRGVGLVTEGVTVNRQSANEEVPSGTHALLVLCQWKDGMCSGVACELDANPLADPGSIDSLSVGVLSQDQVLRIARMPFKPSMIRVGEC